MKDVQLSGSTRCADPVILEVRVRFVADFSQLCDTAAAHIACCAGSRTKGESVRALRTLAHRLAGLAGVIGFPRVSALAKDLEGMVDQLEQGNADVRPAQQLVESLRAAFALELSSYVPALNETTGPFDRGCALVVEDDEDQRAIVMRHLSEAGYRTEGVGSGDLAIGVARALLPSVILLDVEIPGLDGYATCRALKADADLATVPVVFMTARSRIDDRLVGLALGADDYLVKPVDPRELVIRLDRVRARNAARAERDSGGILSYRDFLDVARSRLRQSRASVVLMRAPAERMAQVIARVKDEIRRSDLAAAYDRAHLLLLLPDVSLSTARARTADVISSLAEAGIAGVAAGLAYAETAGSVRIESLVSDADQALLEARHAGTSLAVFGDSTGSSVESATVVLIADDDPDVLAIADAQLRGAGYETRLAFDGAQAMAAIERSRPDVLILDLMMPMLTGFDVLLRLQRLGAPPPRTVVLSARGREEDVLKAFELGADDYVTKPFNPQELAARIARLLR